MAFNVLLYVGVALTIIGFLTWRVAGRHLVLGGATLTALSAYVLSAEGGMRSVWLVVAAILVVVGLLKGRRVDWRQPEILLHGAVVIVLWACYFLYNVVPPEVHKALLVLLGVLGVLVLVVTIQYLVADFRRNQAAGQ